MKIALVQRNYTVGDLGGNAAKIAGAVREARAAGADLVVTSELALTGYPPRDLLLRRSFVEASLQALEQLAQDLRSAPPVLVGIAEPNPATVGRPLFNTAALLANGRIHARFRKRLLPTYDVFDEDRYFEPVPGPQILHLNGRRVGITICEDIWNDCGFWARRRYHADPVEELARAGVDCVINLSADKDRVIHEAFRVLKPGGRFAVSDVVVRDEVPAEVRRNIELWVGCIAGAMQETEYVEKLSQAGFVDIGVEPTRIYNIEDARDFLTAEGIDVDAMAHQVDGKFMSAFVRARRP